MKVDLCDVCARPLWEYRCAYCRGYADGVGACKNRKIDNEIIVSENKRPDKRKHPSASMPIGADAPVSSL